jgi:hypothetical protein
MPPLTMGMAEEALPFTIEDGNGNRTFNIDDGKDEEGSTIDKKGMLMAHSDAAIIDNNDHRDVVTDDGTGKGGVSAKDGGCT